MGGCLSTKKGDIFDNQALDGDAWGWRSSMQLKNDMLSKVGGKFKVEDWLASCQVGTQFCVGKAYFLFSKQQYHISSWKVVWKGWGWNIHKFILWLAYHNRLLIGTMLRQKGLPDATECVLCSADEMDSCEHLFFCLSFHALHLGTPIDMGQDSTSSVGFSQENRLVYKKKMHWQSGYHQMDERLASGYYVWNLEGK